MTSTDAYAALMSHFREIAALGQAAMVLGWDQETTMPERGVTQRAEQLGVLEGISHQKLTDPRIGDWLAVIDRAALDPVQAKNVTEAEHRHHRATRIPARLAEETARLSAHAQGIWADARARSDFAAYAPTLSQMVALKREAGQALRDADESAYDALIQDYEPGMSERELSRIFGDLRPALADLRARIADSPVKAPPLKGPFAKEAQIALSRELATAFGYDWSAGRLDFAVHPFSSGNNGDVRITTRVTEEEPFGCLYSTIHEVGHAVYSQNLDPALMFQPAGEDAGMGVHESQSRSFENQIGRSRAFAEYLFPKMRDAFGDFGAADPEALYLQLNAVETGFIRTEADEVHYNLHVMMRFDLERALISGDLDVADLEAAWNDRFTADFGVTPPDARRGVLQDVHWAHGLFGYFPTYSLGNIYAGELVATLRQDIPDLDSQVAGGNMSHFVGWMKEKIHHPSRRYMPRDLIERAVGHAPSSAPLVAYLERKFTDLYDL
ncbi:carboxypeptidase Taq [Rubricella aquisinus]|uniref:Metal-dependent carboxypeptidase n=1 Tax=Rubricella aquisinus TaxID=2028108 RepID=A0A840WJ42_9RHOB|nr:carboxypeptidase M32 [Rubricella aquisinus]MBB5514531.1 carboxypeptidase Taq [Rubricella aquisinus]